MRTTEIEIPQAWQQIDLSRLRGTVMVVGGTDAGKTTLARYLHDKLLEAGRPVAFVDGDPGQSSLGPPTTMTAVTTDLAIGNEQRGSQHLWRWFVGDVSPRAHMLPLLVGASRLAQATQQAGAQVIVYDTCGLIDPFQGGLNLKLAKIALLQPSTVVALQRSRELEPLLEPLRRNHAITLYELPVSPAAQERTQDSRRSHRARQYAAYFAKAQLLSLQWTRLPVLPKPSFHIHQVVALTNSEGFTIALGIVERIRKETREIALWTPLRTVTAVNALQLGDVLLDPATMQDRRLRLT